MRRQAAAAGRVLVEAFHWRFHPLAARARSILMSSQSGGGLGLIRSVDCEFSIPRGTVLEGDIRLSYELSGGVLMDLGCYCVSALRHLVIPSGEDEEHVRVVRAHSGERSPHASSPRNLTSKPPFLSGGQPALPRAPDPIRPCRLA